MKQVLLVIQLQMVFILLTFFHKIIRNIKMMR
jgi:hypothetical protein